MAHTLHYDHVQPGRIHLLLLLFAALTAVGGGFTTAETGVSVMLYAMAGMFAVLAFSFRELRVRDDGDGLSIRFGPLGWMGRRVRFDAIRSVEATRTTLLDGVGVHWAFVKNAWVWNISLGPAVRIGLERGALVLGTDDVDGLLAFLRARAGLADHAPAR